MPVSFGGMHHHAPSGTSTFCRLIHSTMGLPVVFTRPYQACKQALWLDVVFKLVTEIMFDHGANGHCGPHRRGHISCDPECHLHAIHCSKSLSRPAVFNAAHHATTSPYPSRQGVHCRSSMHVKVRQAQQALHHAARVIHDDDRARTQHGSCFSDGVVVRVGGHHDVSR